MPALVARLGAVALATFLLSLPQAARAQLVRSGVGAGATAARDQFRLDLGSQRTEITWDGVPDDFSAPNNLPADFFNVTVPRGIVLSTPGTGFRVGADASNPTGTPVEFGDLDPSYPGTFAAFSPERLFTALGSNVVDISFFLPGTTIASTTRGFGSIFSDVDLSNTTSIQYFDQAGSSLGTFLAGNVPGGSEVPSFLGVSFADPIISRVRITAGNVAPGTGVLDNNQNQDVVVMDDFLFTTPTAVPEPPGLAMLVVAGLGLIGYIRYARERAS